jgi:hypothetical protein
MAQYGVAAGNAPVVVVDVQRSAMTAMPPALRLTSLMISLNRAMVHYKRGCASFCAGLMCLLDYLIIADPLTYFTAAGREFGTFVYSKTTGFDSAWPGADTALPFILPRPRLLG